MDFREKSWLCGRRTLRFGAPAVMGIVNVTPDSFFAGSRTPGVEAAVARGHQLAAEGASILDVGGESTRPGAEPLSEAEELSRVAPAIRALREALPEMPLSVDTRHVAVARAAIDAGADIVNDVSGLEPEPGMAELIAASGAGYVLTHGRGVALVQDGRPALGASPVEVLAALEAAASRLEAAGADPRQIALDPGLGFEKSAEASWRLLAATARLAATGRVVLVGASRKRFLDEGATPEARGAASVGAALWAASQGANVLRAHDVGTTVGALRAFRKAEVFGREEDAADA